MAHLRGRAVQDTEPGPGRSFLISRFRRSLGYAVNGLVHVWRHHPNLRMEVVLLLVCVLLALLLKADLLPILVSWGLVLGFEVMNTAVEITVDLLSPDYNVQAGLAKDVSAGAVLLAALTTAVVNAWVLLPPLLRLMGLVD